MKIENCPFCNNSILDLKTEKLSGRLFCHVKCPKCGATGPKGLSPESSILWWNNRSITLQKSQGDTQGLQWFIDEGGAA